MRLRHRLRSLWRQRVRPAWLAVRWPFLIAAWCGALALGTIGYAQHLGIASTWADAARLLVTDRTRLLAPLYQSLQLFVLEFNVVLPRDGGSAPLPRALEAARFLAPGIAGFTALQALLLLITDEWWQLRLRIVRDHVVICGLDRMGRRLARGFHELGEWVVVIERDGHNPRIDRCRADGILVVIGDATEREQLVRVGAHRARHIVAVCGHDGVNAEIAVHARGLVRARRAAGVTCTVHVADPLLWHELGGREISARDEGVFRLDFINIFESGARAMLAGDPVLGDRARSAPHPPHLLVVGVGGLGRSLIVRAARRWWVLHRGAAGRAAAGLAPGRRLRISLVDLEANEIADVLRLRYPQLERACDLAAWPFDVRSVEFERAAFLHDEGGSCSVTGAYVCFDDDVRALETALKLRHRLRGQGVPITVRMSHDAGLATLLEGTGEAPGEPRLRSFSLLDRTCTPDLVIGGAHELIARAVHDAYRRQHQAQGEGDARADDHALRAWRRLPESLKESNRRKADHIEAKLRAIGCGIERLTDWDADLFTLTPGEVESLAEMEHERWCGEHLREGWRTGQTRDAARKVSPDLVPWSVLPEPSREKDRAAVRAIPALLASVDLQIYRLP